MPRNALTQTLRRAAPWIACLTCVTGAAQAQDTQYQSFLVGERAAGMGGAYTAIADDASAAFYNPAGLAMVESSSLSGSLQVNAFSRYEVKDGYGSPVGVANLTHDEQPSLPIFVGIVRKFGPRDADGQRRHAVGLATYHPQRRSRRYQVDLFDATTGVETRLQVESDDSVTWYGPSYAFLVAPTFSLGISAFLASRTQHHVEDETIVTRGMADPASGGFYRNPSLSLRQLETEVDTRHAVFRIGALWEPHPRVRVGVMFQPPGILLDDSGSIGERLAFADGLADPPYGTFARYDQSDLLVEAPVPWELRVGGSYTDGDWLTLSADASLYGPNGSAADPIRALDGIRPDAATGGTPAPGKFQVTAWHRELTANLSVGAETVIADVVPLRVGAFTNFSSAPSIDGPSDRYSPDDVDSYGATFSIGLRTEGYDINLGVAGSIGSGDGLRLNPFPGAAEAPQAYLPTTVETQTLMVFLNGYKAAVRRAARAVYREAVSSGTPTPAPEAPRV